MKSAIIICCFIMNISASMAQVNLGISMADTKRYLRENGISFTVDRIEDQPVLYYENGNSTYCALFSEEDKCFSVLAIPETIGRLNALVEQYNKTAVIIEKNHWQMYLKNGSIVDIKLEPTQSESTRRKSINWIFIYTDGN